MPSSTCKRCVFRNDSSEILKQTSRYLWYMSLNMSAPVAIFTCRPNSHPFDERHIPLTEPVKIGRSVARARPAANNAIFDCKVLSRNHALLWYENGKVRTFFCCYSTDTDIHVPPYTKLKITFTSFTIKWAIKSLKVGWIRFRMLKHLLYAPSSLYSSKGMYMYNSSKPDLSNLPPGDICHAI